MEYRKKLIEVALPLAAINAESAREKSIRHGHPSTLHLWWARRPLAACRAVLFASLVDDPDSDPQYIKPDGTLDEEAAGIKRADLFNLIEELVMWENSNNSSVIRSARAEIARCVASRHIETGKLNKETVIWSVDKDMPDASPEHKKPVKQQTWNAWDLVTRCHCKPRHGMIDKKVARVRFSFDVDHLPPAEVVNSFLAGHAPPVLDPFAGGGSIPLEAQRLGLRAFASDLNPIPVLINKAMIELPPKFYRMSPINNGWQSKKHEERSARVWNNSEGLAADVRFYGTWMLSEAEKRIGNLYPLIEVSTQAAAENPSLEPYIGKKLRVVTWLWARTVACPNPIYMNAHVPLVGTYRISAKKGKEKYIHPVVADDFKITFNVKDVAPEGDDGTIRRGGATCLLSRTNIDAKYIREQGKKGLLREMPIALVLEGHREKLFVSPSISTSWYDEFDLASMVPQEEIVNFPGRTNCVEYGFTRWCDLFTKRQLVALCTFSSLVSNVYNQVTEDCICSGRDADSTKKYAEAICLYLSFAVDRAADFWSTFTTWVSSGDFINHVFRVPGIRMTWDFPEANPFSDSGGNWIGTCVEWIAKVIEELPSSGQGSSKHLSAELSIAEHSGIVVSTDPPYYDNICYAELADYFYVWLRRSLSFLNLPELATILTPKTNELVANRHRHGGDKEVAGAFFESGLRDVLTAAQLSQSHDIPLTIFYAFKQSEEDDTAGVSSTGWDTILSALCATGFEIVGTWPVRTERQARSMAIEMNALASSIVLVCRPRSINAKTATRREFLSSLRKELPIALRTLQKGNIAPVDLAQAAIGPGMAVFSRFERVLESDGLQMTVQTALGLINQSLDEVLDEQEGEFDSDTRWALAWFEQFGMDEGLYGDAELLSKAKNTAVNALVDAGVIVAKAGKVRLVNRHELPEHWEPSSNKRVPVWEATQHLVHRLDKYGEMDAARLLVNLGNIAEVARDLAYRLFSTCERKKRASEAMAYNSLVVAWPELSKIARSTGPKEKVVQVDLF